MSTSVSIMPSREASRLTAKCPSGAKLKQRPQPRVQRRKIGPINNGWPLLLVGLVVVSACMPSDGSDGPPPEPTATTLPGGAGGVASDVTVVDPVTRDEWLAQHPPQTDPDGVRIRLQTCAHHAPGHWRLDGQVELPRGVGSTVAGLEFSQTETDMIRPAGLFQVTFSGEGDFTMEHTTSLFQQDDDSLLLDPSLDWAEECVLRTLWSEVPFSDVWAEIPAEHQRTPLWSPEPGSVQALGVGADLADRNDPRLLWAHLAWAEEPLPFERIWAPRLESGIRAVALRYHPDAACPHVTTSLLTGEGPVTVIQGESCDMAALLGSEPVDAGPVPGADGFRWLRNESELLAWVEDDLYQVFVQAEAPELVEEVSAALESYANVPTGDE